MFKAHLIKTLSNLGKDELDIEDHVEGLLYPPNGEGSLPPEVEEAALGYVVLPKYAAAFFTNFMNDTAKGTGFEFVCEERKFVRKNLN